MPKIQFLFSRISNQSLQSKFQLKNKLVCISQKHSARDKKFEGLELQKLFSIIFWRGDCYISQIALSFKVLAMPWAIFGPGQEPSTSWPGGRARPTMVNTGASQESVSQDLRMLTEYQQGQKKRKPIAECQGRNCCIAAHLVARCCRSDRWFQGEGGTAVMMERLTDEVWYESQWIMIFANCDL